MAQVTMRDLLEAGVHFGHQTNRWNPKMRPYIYGARNGIHIVDLSQTVRLFASAYDFITKRVGKGGSVLFVGTKKQAQETVSEQADRANQYFIVHRWLGGTLTNFQTIRKSIDRLKALDKMSADGSYEKYTKKEVLNFERERAKLNANVGGIQDMNGLPSALFVLDPKKEEIAIKEANKLKIPVVAVCDTNCDPAGVDYVIPGNDDAIRSIRLFTSAIADACLEGSKSAKGRREESARDAARSSSSYNAGGSAAAPDVQHVGKVEAKPEAKAEVKAEAAPAAAPEAAPAAPTEVKENTEA